MLVELAHPDSPCLRGNLLGAIAYAMHSQMNAAMIATTSERTGYYRNRMMRRT